MANNSTSVECRNERPLSPCVLICTLDEDKRCIGCGRTAQQISRWALMSPDEQWAVVDQLARRGEPV
ncbi:MAG: DUF1289 domain-containing protein [Gammaproteobacteria bacterium]|nr:DUF1289 domain-containing protein [Gammaproteobacteria bacterium]